MGLGSLHVPLLCGKRLRYWTWCSCRLMSKLFLRLLWLVHQVVLALRGDSLLYKTRNNWALCLGTLLFYIHSTKMSLIAKICAGSVRARRSRRGHRLWARSELHNNWILFSPPFLKFLGTTFLLDDANRAWRNPLPNKATLRTLTMLRNLTDLNVCSVLNRSQRHHMTSQAVQGWLWRPTPIRSQFMVDWFVDACNEFPFRTYSLYFSSSTWDMVSRAFAYYVAEVPEWWMSGNNVASASTMTSMDA